MKIKQAVIIFLLAITIFLLMPRSSGADATLPEAKTMPVGAMMPRTPDEECANKYGSNWKNFTPTLCQKG